MFSGFKVHLLSINKSEGKHFKIPSNPNSATLELCLHGRWPSSKDTGSCVMTDFRWELSRSRGVHVVLIVSFPVSLTWEVVWGLVSMVMRDAHVSSRHKRNNASWGWCGKFILKSEYGVGKGIVSRRWTTTLPLTGSEVLEQVAAACEVKFLNYWIHSSLNGRGKLIDWVFYESVLRHVTVTAKKDKSL